MRILKLENTEAFVQKSSFSENTDALIRILKLLWRYGSPQGNTEALIRIVKFLRILSSCENTKSFM